MRIFQSVPPKRPLMNGPIRGRGKKDVGLDVDRSGIGEGLGVNSQDVFPRQTEFSIIRGLGSRHGGGARRKGAISMMLA